MIYIGIIISLIIFTIIVFIHELGHFLSARFFGVKVEEFGIGIPPRASALHVDKKGTVYTINWLPLGGFVRLKGENISDTNNIDDKESFINKGYFAKSIILLAGVFMNFVLAGIIYSFLFFVGVSPVGINDKIETNTDSKIIPSLEYSYEIGLLEKNKGLVLNPVEGSLAKKSGIESGDIVYNANGIEVDDFSDLTEVFKQNIGNEVILKIDNTLNKSIDWTLYDPPNGESSIKKEIKIVIPEDAKIGTYVGENIFVNRDFEFRYGFFGSIKNGFYETYSQGLLTIKGLGVLFKKIVSPENETDRKEALEGVKGPIGLVDIISSSIGNGIKFLLILSALISINLGIFNLLPIPALDGGRFIMISINDGLKLILGKKIIGEKMEGMIHLIFFIILIALSILVGYNDINNLVNGR